MRRPATSAVKLTSTTSDMIMPSDHHGIAADVVFYQPHANIWFKNPVRKIIRNQRLPNKYEAFFDHVLAGDARVHLTTSLLRSPGLKGWLKFMIEPLELLLWCLLNHVPLRRVGFVLRKKSLAGKGVLFLMHYGNFTHESQEAASNGRRLAAHLADAPTFKVVHMTHFAYHPTIGAENLRILRPDLLVAENHLQRNSAFFRRYFGALPVRFETLPYTAAPRFENRTDFGARKNKAVATGSITYKMKAPEFIAFYGTDELQPLRRKIFESAAVCDVEIECLISDLNASRAVDQTHSASGIARSLAARLFGRHPQLSYYKTDIVSTYNAHTMFVVPEEVCDLPAIGFVEGMACGCAYIGLDSPMYRDLGMVPGVHFIAYDGTLSGLTRTIRHYQAPEHREALKQVAARGQAFAQYTLRRSDVYDAFLRGLKHSVLAHAANCQR